MDEDYSVNADISFMRQIEIFDPEKYIDKKVTIVGVGNIGSQTALALARLGISNFELWDDDIVEAHNLSSQSFFQGDKGKKKVDACYEQIKAVNPSATVVITDEKFSIGEDDEIRGIYIVATDSMESRKEICQMMKDKGTFPDLILDGRMGGPQLEIYTIQSFEEWESKFFAVPEPDSCGARYVCYISMAMGAFMANQVKRFLNEQPIKKNIAFHIDTYEIIAI